MTSAKRSGKGKDGKSQAGKSKRRGVQLELFPQEQVQEQPQQTESAAPSSSAVAEREPKLSYADRIATAQLVAAQYHTSLDRGAVDGGGAWYDTHDELGFGDAISLLLTLRAVSRSSARMTSTEKGWVVSVLLA